MLSHKKNLDKLTDEERETKNPFGSQYNVDPIPKYKIPKKGMPSEIVYEGIHNDLTLDGNPSMNLASFVTIWMEPEADKLINENIGKNFIDIDAYPESAKIQDRIINMLANLYNSPSDCESIGTGTIGSSEAIMLGLLAHKWNWKKQRKAKGKSTDKPNLVIGADGHTVWEKFALYFDVELRLIPLRENLFITTAEDIIKEVDENTICVGTVLGTTYTGESDPVKEINDALVKIKEEKGWDIPIHVDAATGGFILPFSQPEVEWDFRLGQVRSINVSGHKYGLVYPGMGWLIFKDQEDLPEDLIFDINYLGGLMPNYSLNFSRGSSMVIAQYYNLLRFGMEGYTNIINNIMDNANYLKNELIKTNKFTLTNENLDFPVIVFSLNTDKFTVFDVSKRIRTRGWIVPAYTLPKNASNIAVLRVVIKENMGRNMISKFIEDLLEVCSELENNNGNNNENLSLLY